MFWAWLRRVCRPRLAGAARGHRRQAVPRWRSVTMHCEDHISDASLLSTSVSHQGHDNIISQSSITLAQTMSMSIRCFGRRDVGSLKLAGCLLCVFLKRTAAGTTKSGLTLTLRCASSGAPYPSRPSAPFKDSVQTLNTVICTVMVNPTVSH
jgi:hypothetical protein